MPIDEVHAEADRLEHALSEELEARIDETLGFPTHDPHGDPIPDADLNVGEDKLRPLHALGEGERSTVRRVPRRHRAPALPARARAASGRRRGGRAQGAFAGARRRGHGRRRARHLVRARRPDRRASSGPSPSIEGRPRETSRRSGGHAVRSSESRARRAGARGARRRARGRHRPLAEARRIGARVPGQAVHRFGREQGRLVRADRPLLRRREADRAARREGTERSRDVEVDAAAAHGARPGAAERAVRRLRRARGRSPSSAASSRRRSSSRRAAGRSVHGRSPARPSATACC